MEFHPILEKQDQPSIGLWYVISSPDPPNPRVGQALTCVEGSDCNDVYLVGGADPSMAYNDVHRFDTKTFKWCYERVTGVTERYEHSAMISCQDPNKIFIFGGSNQEGNLNSTEVINKKTGKCEDLVCTGHLPKARTIHSAATADDCMYVWGGGHRGTDPVSDLSLHVLDVKSARWSRFRLKGEVPAARHGHVCAVVRGKLYLHGGMAGSEIFADLYRIDLTDHKSSLLSVNGKSPSARAGHSCCRFEDKIFIFGGLTKQGPSDELFYLNTNDVTWTQVRFEGPPPCPRLDHSAIVTHIKCCQTHPRKESTNDITDDVTTPKIIPVDLWESVSGAEMKMQHLNISRESVDEEELHKVPVLMIFGGMDTSGNLFNDLLVTRIDSLLDNTSST